MTLYSRTYRADGNHFTTAMMWQTKFSWLVIFLFVFMVSGCCPSYDSGSKARDEEARQWLRSWPGSYDWAKITQWKNVSESRMQKAEMLLQAKASVRITTEQAHDLIGESGFPEELGVPYLLRAVGDGGGKWPQEVYMRPSGEMWVGGGANSRCPVPMRRRGVIVWLKDAPSEVYVTFVVGK